MSDEEAALLRAICAEPDDDTPRLVYADWLEEQGEALAAAHAAFIRLSVAEARTPVMAKRASGRGEVWDRHREHQALLSMVGRNLVGNALAKRMGVSREGTGYSRPPRWDRGLPALMICPSVAAWARSAATFARVPLTRCRVLGRVPAWIMLPNGAAYVWFRQHGPHLRRSDCLPSAAYDMLSESPGYAEAHGAHADAERAFVDAGRVACGLAPRFFGSKEPGHG
jgi:uncharacterized protein (TIGR02996 family)